MLLNGDTGYEIQEGDDTHTVCLEKNTCTCSAWDISGIPCQHAICVLVHNKQEPMDHISNFYHIDMYRAAYQFKIMSLRGKKLHKMDQYLQLSHIHWKIIEEGQRIRE